MKERNDYYVVKKKAVPEVLLKVVESQTSSGFRKGTDRSGGYREGRHQPEFILQV